MIEFQGTSYKLAQIDTGVMSEMLKYPKREFANYLSRYFAKYYLPCISVFTLLELMEANKLLNLFLDTFSIIPCFIIQGYEQLVKLEMSFPSRSNKINPIILSTMSIIDKSGKSKRELFVELLSSKGIQIHRERWMVEKKSILEGMKSLINNYPPKTGKYSQAEIIEFVDSVVTNQLVLRNNTFDKIAKNLDSNLYPSLKTMAYYVFMKFYRNPRRISVFSDVFDIIMSASIPYVDAIFIEGQMAASITEIKKLDPFLAHVEVYTISSLR
jgi:hypothetical protein